jgi:hypothetical protein
MSVLEQAFSDGQLAAWRRHKLAWPSTTHPVVQQSAILKSQPTPPQPPIPAPASTPAVVSETFDRHEQGETRMEPRRKLSASMGPLARDMLLGGIPNALATALTADPESRVKDTLLSGVGSGVATAALGHLLRAAAETDSVCGTCRQRKHYGPCKKPIPIKQSNFNLGMTAGDANDGGPATSPHYHSATSANSALARARDGRPADEQASSAFADLFRHLGITNVADEPGRMYGGLNKVSQFMLPNMEAHSRYEKRGPTVNPYEERVMAKSPPVAWGDEGAQRLDRAFNNIDNAVDSTCIESVVP